MAAYNITVGTAAPEQVAGFNPRRRVLGIFNNDTTNFIFLSQDRTSVTTRGYPVGPRGQVILMWVDGDEPETEWWAQATAGSPDVRVLEQMGPGARREPIPVA